MKKISLQLVFFVFLCSSIFVLTGCFHKEEKTYMDKPAEDGKYHYQNKDLGFSVTLPSEFIYYQTQRKETEEYMDIEFFVPTTTEYRHEVPGYGKPMVVRIFEKRSWEEVDEDYKIDVYSEIGENDGKIYTIKFWELAPEDWDEKWTTEIENEIVESFKILKN